MNVNHVMILFTILVVGTLSSFAIGEICIPCDEPVKVKPSESKVPMEQSKTTSSKTKLNEDSLNKLLAEKPVSGYFVDYNKMIIKIVFTDKSFVILDYHDNKTFLISVENLKNVVDRVDEIGN